MLFFQPLAHAMGLMDCHEKAGSSPNNIKASESAEIKRRILYIMNVSHESKFLHLLNGGGCAVRARRQEINHSVSNRDLLFANPMRIETKK